MLAVNVCASIPLYVPFSSAPNSPTYRSPGAASSISGLCALTVSIGIIHGATHGNEGVSKLKSEDEVVLLMIAYIDKIVKIVKPTQVCVLE